MARLEKSWLLKGFDWRWLGIPAIAILVLAGYFFLGHPGHDVSMAPQTHAEQITGKQKAALWICPMHPQIQKNQPGVCPICGMDLVEMSPVRSHEHGIAIDTASRQKLGVRLASAEMQTLSQDIHAYGNVLADESLSFNLSSKLEGVIKKLHVNSVGQQIDQGQVIYEVYSAELLKAQFEFVALLKEKNILLAEMMSEDSHVNGYEMPEKEMMEVRENARNRNLYTEKFEYYDASHLIEELNNTYRPREVVDIRAPKAGFVSKIEVHEGSAIKAMDNLFSFTNPSRVLIDVPLFPDQLAWVQDKDEVSVRLPNSGMPEIKARLQFITPLVDSATRTVSARLSLDNTQHQLRIGSFVDAIIHARPHQALAVPRSAILRTGKGDWVMLAEGEGRYLPVKVKTGIETDDAIEILSGLQAGDQVAVNGQFLLDAAASMQDTAQRMQSH